MIKIELKKIKWIGITICILLFILLLSTTSDLLGWFGSSSAIEVSIPEGAGISKLASILKEQNIISYASAFRLYAKMNKPTIKPGSIHVSPGLSYKEILTEAANAENGIKVTIPEGFESYKIAARLKELGIIEREDDFIAALDNASYDYPFLKDITREENKLEGYLFPETYLFDPEASPGKIIKAMLNQFNEHFKEEYYTRAVEIGMSIDDVITLASIVEREAVNKDEMARVAGVFHNRLKSTDLPYLQSCATVQYVLKERKAVLSTADTKIESPYNTYKYKGLPIGPIASPSIEAIEATLYSEEHDYYFFVYNEESGKHIFSKTYEEHLRAKP